MLEPAKPFLTDEALKGMTAEQVSRAGVSLRFKLEIPAGSNIHYDLLVCPTKDLAKHKGKAQIVATYTEVDGVCKAHALTKDDEIGIQTLIGLVRFREMAERQGVPLHCASVVHADAALEV